MFTLQIQAFYLCFNLSAKHFTLNNLFIMIFMQRLGHFLRSDWLTSYSRHSERDMTSTGILGILSGIRTGDNINGMGL